MKRKKKVRWIRRMLGELIQVVGQNTDIMKKQDEMFRTMVSLVQQALNNATQQDWLIITTNIKINTHDLSSVQIDPPADAESEEMWHRLVT